MKPGSSSERRVLIAAHVLTLIALASGLQFVTHTTGGTLFVFTSVAPFCALASTAAVLGVAISRFVNRHRLFDFRTYRPGEAIIRQGECGDCAYFIESGEVEVVRDGQASSTVLARLAAGEYFGEMALVTNEPRNATVRALTPVRVALLGKHNFLQMLRLVAPAQENVMKTVRQRAPGPGTQQPPAEAPLARDPKLK